ELACYPCRGRSNRPNRPERQRVAEADTPDEPGPSSVDQMQNQLDAEPDGDEDRRGLEQPDRSGSKELAGASSLVPERPVCDEVGEARPSGQTGRPPGSTAVTVRRGRRGKQEVWSDRCVGDGTS